MGAVKTSPRLTARTVLGRSSSGWRLGGDHVHAVESDNMISISPALCGTRPGRLSPGWSPPEDQRITCPRCLHIIKMQREGHDPHGKRCGRGPMRRRA